MTEQQTQETATRATLSEDWQRQRLNIDWMGAPQIAAYVNGLVSGRPLPEGHWANYVCRNHLRPLRKRLGRDLRVLSLGSGDGHIERALVTDFEWPIATLTGLEFDAELRKRAYLNFSDLGVPAEFRFFDFNNPGIPETAYDVVFTHHALHHAFELEQMLSFIERALNDESLIVGSEYLGPTQFQVTPEARSLIEHLYRILPMELKRDLRHQDKPPSRRLQFPTAKEVFDADPSESVRSSDLRTLLFARFDILERRPMGGTILRWLLQYRAGNFDHSNPCHVSIASLLSTIEKLCIESKAIQSDDVLFVLKRQSKQRDD